MELGDWIMIVTMWFLFITAFITVIQRMLYVRKQFLTTKESA